MSTDIRIKAGTHTSYDLLNDSTSLVTNWTRTSDQSVGVDWLVAQSDGFKMEFVPSLEIGTGGYYGGYAGTIEFFVLTPLMRDYVENTLLGGRGTAKVSIYAHYPQGLGADTMACFVGALTSPFTLGSSEYVRYDDTYYWNVRYAFTRGTINQTASILMESGDYILTEAGDRIALEDQ